MGLIFFFFCFFFVVFGGVLDSGGDRRVGCYQLGFLEVSWVQICEGKMRDKLWSMSFGV